MSDIRIFVACHKECMTIKNKYLYPIQVGCAVNNQHFEGFLHDDDGENISEKNLQYCELTAQYWAWKNCKDADYYGLFHYRRYMSFSDSELNHNKFGDVLIDFIDDKIQDYLGLTDEKIEKFISQYDVIATESVSLKKLDPILKSNYHQYAISDDLFKGDLDVVLDIIREKYPEYISDSLEYIHSESGYFCNMFIMRREVFQDYCEWLFDILFEHEKRVDLKEYNINQIRVSGHLAERLFGIYYLHLQKQGYKCTEVQRTLFKNVDIEEALTPYFNTNNVAVTFASNDYFAPYLACTLRSLIDNSSTEYCYDIFILTEDFSSENKKIFFREFSSENISIRFVNPSKFINTDKLYLRGHFSKETYYRLVLPQIFEKFDKILYLDADVVVLSDVAELFYENISDKLVAATVDADSAGLYNGSYERGKRKYVDDKLKLSNPYGYFQAGVILFNLDMFRKEFKNDELVRLAGEYNWQLLDQDVLNILCQGRVKYLDMSWNVLVDFDRIRIKEIISKAPYDIYHAYSLARKKPKIIHYAGPTKPWNNLESDFSSIFWEFAKRTRYYEVLMYRMALNTSASTPIVSKIRNHFVVYVMVNLKKCRMRYHLVKKIIKACILRK